MLTDDETGTVAQCMDLFKYVIWKSKQRRHLPNSVIVSRELRFLLETACKMSQWFHHRLVNNNLIANFFQARG